MGAGHRDDTGRDWLQRLVILAPTQRARAWPFFATYLLLFAALTIAEALSMALFVQRVGASALPAWYAGMALANLVLVGAYVAFADRLGSSTLFRIIVGLCGVSFIGVWALIQGFGASTWVFGSLFVVREVAYTLFLMHFGTWLQDFFSREELNRVMPFVYAGGRVGGVVGGAALATLSGVVGLEALLFVSGLCAIAAALYSYIIDRRVSRSDGVGDMRGASGLAGAAGLTADELDAAGQKSWRGFAFFVRKSPLAYWTTITALVYVVCRWVLNFQYNTWFGAHFSDEAAMATFLGQYAMVALAFSVLFQIAVIGRVVERFGLHAAQMGYAVIMAGAFAAHAVAPALWTAVYGRFVENELRYGWRNPINQLILNKFSKPMRIRMRAWSIGVVIPTATFATGLMLQAMRTSSGWVVGLAGACAGGAYLWGSMRMTRTFRDGDGAAGGDTAGVGVQDASDGQREGRHR